MKDPKQIGIIFDRAVAAGNRVIRTWGFNEMNSALFYEPFPSFSLKFTATKITGGLPQYNNDVSDTWLNYFQSWTNGTPSISACAI
jgi:hypothetical protein